MVSAIRQARRERQKKHIPSKMAFNSATNQWIPNPEIKKKPKVEPKFQKNKKFRK